jgi:hypothetical protein
MVALRVCFPRRRENWLTLPFEGLLDEAADGFAA